MPKGYHKLSALEIIALNNVLKDAIDPSTADYRDPKRSDVTVAADLGPRYSANNVAGLRRQIFGNKQPKPKPNNIDLNSCLEALELWASLRPKTPFQL